MIRKHYKVTTPSNHTFKYTPFQWNLAWFLCFLFGVFLGIAISNF